MVTGTREGTLGASISARSHTLLSGISRQKGGDDEGFDPHEFAEAALAACTIITVQMYANRKSWPLDSIDVKVSIDREGAEAHISRQVELTGHLSDDQREKLLAIANRCPIHKLLTSKIEIETKLVDGTLPTNANRGDANQMSTSL